MTADHIRKSYKPRIVDKEISRLLSIMGGVQIVGCKWCGKSWTGTMHSRSSVYIGTLENRKLAEMSPETILAGDEPRLVDEWQDVPNLWDVARYKIDFENRKGMFIFAGSSIPPLNSTSHTGTGRFATVTMRPMSLFESGISSGSVSLSKMFTDDTIVSGTSEMNYEKAIRLICRGGWPSSLGFNDEDAFDIPKRYGTSIVGSDLSRIDGKRRNKDNFSRLLGSIARNVATAATIRTLIKDMAGEDSGLSEITVRDYLAVLKKMFVIEEQYGWKPEVRSRTRIRSSPKRHFVDPSLAVMFLKANFDKLVKDPNTSGLLFESLCYRDVSIYASLLGGNVSYYRDGSGLEADMIVETNDGRWGAIEVKMGHMDVDDGARNLLRLKKKFAHQTAPSFLMILCATCGGAYMRDDGVAVVPIDCFGP